ncbi:Reeler domain containing protein [Euroglyphus maynei]|uniref:Reeler domain containing protein n=1 Tax=Euroglyphus maynei TaxID=6958 RepID=A0A1Y3B032_EURMA|nr:Reeler domain containing protein [Euroglyphus maynei]
MKQSIFAIILVVLLSGCMIIHGYPTGAPKCSATAPKHEDHKAQTTPSPYQITATKKGKSTASVTISGAEFKGFMLYATKPGSNDMIGTFTKNDKSKEITCGSAVSLKKKI